MMLFDSIRNRPFIAGAALLMGTVCAYWGWIRPFDISYTEAVRKAADFRERRKQVELELGQLQEKQRAIDRSLHALQSLHKDSPTEPAIVWVPTHIKSAFSHFGLRQPDVQLDRSASDWELPDYARTDWYVVMPPRDKKRKLTDVLLAVAQIEQAGPFVKIQNLSLDLACEEAGDSIGYLKLTTYLPK